MKKIEEEKKDDAVELLIAVVFTVFLFFGLVLDSPTILLAGIFIMLVVAVLWFKDLISKRLN